MAEEERRDAPDEGAPDTAGEPPEPAAESEQEPAVESEEQAPQDAGADSTQDEAADQETTPQQPDAGAEQPDAGVEQPDAGADVAAASAEQPAADAAAEPEPAEGDADEPTAAAPEPTEGDADEPAAAPTGETGAAADAPPPPAADETVSRSGPEAIPGEHLEPDLVLEEEVPGEESFATYAEETDTATQDVPAVEAADGDRAEAAPAERTPLDLAADARYPATGKRKTSVARVILRPGSGAYTVNGRPLDAYFPRAALQRAARQPLETAGYETRMDVVARIHGGGVAAQAGALRHGVARALIEADPALRGELKRRGFLTRDARAKERKKAGLKKARKRPQFSKR